MTVSEIMTKSPAVCTPRMPISEVARMMVKHDCGAVPVVEGQDEPRPLGVITDRDIVVRLVAAEKNPLVCTVADAMSEGMATVSPDMTLQQAELIMETNQVRRAPVVDKRGVVIGIISQADIAQNADSKEVAALMQAVSEEEELINHAPMGGAYSG